MKQSHDVLFLGKTHHSVGYVELQKHGTLVDWCFSNKQSLAKYRQCFAESTLTGEQPRESFWPFIKLLTKLKWRLTPISKYTFSPWSAVLFIHLVCFGGTCQILEISAVEMSAVSSVWWKYGRCHMAPGAQKSVCSHKPSPSRSRWSTHTKTNQTGKRKRYVLLTLRWTVPLTLTQVFYKPADWN